MTIARRGLKIKVKVMGQINAVHLTSIEGSLFFIFLVIVTARRYVSTVLAVIVCPSVRPSVRQSVCLSDCHKPVLYQNG